jgi:spermidine synthase
MPAMKIRLLLRLLVVAAACVVALAEDKVLYEQQSQYNNILVTVNDEGLRSLRFEKGGAQQSAVKVGDPDHLEIPYVRGTMAGLVFCEKPQRVLVIGLGGGSIPSFLHKHYPQAAIDVVDIDPEVVSVAKRFFGFREDATMRAHVADGRKFIEDCREPYDIIVLDAYGKDSIPYSLATVEFIRSVKRALSPRGIVVSNVWSRQYNRLYDAMVRTYQEVFDEMYVFDLEDSGNKILVGLPRAERLKRDELAKCAKRISKENKFRFDLGELVAFGYQFVSEKDPSARVLMDKADLDPALLKADPWVTPPHNWAETKERVAELREQYAPYLRSLPEKLDVRARQDLGGQWRSKFEITDSEDGKRPEPPDWFREDYDDSAWETTTVPEWRWSPVKKGGRWYPASCILWYRTRFTTTASGKRVFLCFAGVDWEAEVWLNGKFLGRHKVYYEAFRFDVTGLLKAKNTLAVRVIEGPAFREPMSQWSLLPFSPGDAAPNQRHVLGSREKSIPDFPFGTTSSLGSGFGIHREVFLETTAEACVTEIFARGYPKANEAKVTVETDATAAKELTLDVQILPENFEGRAYRKTARVRLPGKHALTIPMPGARLWWPAEPFLYRCRVTLRDGKRVVDVRDVLFGCRSFRMVSEGQFLLNDRPIYLRGSNASAAFNAFWYWNEPDKLMEAALLLKAANFNALRICQHVSFPEVRELFDRLGIMTEQDQGAGFASKGHETESDLALTGAPLARTCYNNPGVVLLSFVNECHLDVTDVVEAALKTDPERILVPASGATYALRKPEYEDRVIGDFHPYDAWYGGLHRLWDTAAPRKPERLRTAGEFGAEALDAYETMAENYPSHWGKPPAPTEDKLWGARQCGKGDDLRQVFGFRGKPPANLAEYITASQTYQADALAEATKGFRLSKQAMAGYFQFHFVDATAAHWPKAIVSHDLRPKMAYYEMAQVNQPIVPLYRLIERGAAIELWVANDLTLALPGCKVKWTVQTGKQRSDGEVTGNVRADDAACLGRVELPAGPDVIVIALTLTDSKGRKISEYQREIYRSFREVDLALERAKIVTPKKPITGKINLALKKNVTATSAREHQDAAQAVDGHTRTGWRAADNTLPQSFTVDLGERAALCGVRLIWEDDGERRFTLQFSDDNKQWRSVSGKQRSTILKVPRPPLMFLDQFVLFEDAARYMRITITATPAGVLA